MNKQIKLLISMTLVMVLIAMSIHFSVATYNIGDINNDNKISAVDARTVLRYSAKLASLTPEQLKLADVNFDGNVTAVDARTILRVSAKLTVFTDMPTTEPTTKAAETTTTPTTQQENNNSQTVYVTPTGKRYHLISSCGGKNSSPISIDDARRQGLSPCQKCAI